MRAALDLLESLAIAWCLDLSSLRSVRLPSDEICSLRRARRDASLERLGHAHKALIQFIRIRHDRLPRLFVDSRLDVKSPNKSRDSQEQATLCDVHSCSDSSASSEGELVALGGIWILCRVVQILLVVFEVLRVKGIGI